MKSDELRIRPAMLNDAAIIAAFNRAMAYESEGRALNADRLLAGVRQALADPNKGVYTLAEIEGKCVGQLFITREWSDWRNGWFWWIQSVYVTPEARRRGVYRALHGHVEQAARRDEAVCGLRLYLDARNTGAQEVYQKLGLTRTNYQLYESDWNLKSEL